MKKRKLKKQVVIPVVIALLLVILAIIKIVFSNTQTGKYGHRLDDIKKIKVEEKDENKISKKLKEDDKVVSVEIDVEGKIINILMVVKDDCSKDDARSIASKSLEAISDKIKEKYDVQIFVNKKNKSDDDKDFPMIGYRNSKNNSFVW